MKRKFKYDNNAQTSGGFKLIAIIIIGLLVWEFGFPYLGLNSLSATLGYSEPSPGELTFDVNVENDVIGVYTPTKVLLDVDNDPRNEDEDYVVYPMIKNGWVQPLYQDYLVDKWNISINTNSPITALFPYSIVVKLKRVDDFHKITTKTILNQAITSENDKAINIELHNNDISMDDVSGLRRYTIVFVELHSPFGSIINNYDFACFNAGEVLA